MKEFPHSEKILIMKQSACHISKVANGSLPETALFDKIDKFCGDTPDFTISAEDIENIEVALKEASSVLQKQSSNYDTKFMLIGQGLLLVGLCLMTYNIAMCPNFSKRISKDTNMYSLLKYCLMSGIMFHSLSMLSSSFIEEEHQTWYFLVTTVLVIIICILFKEMTTGVITLDKDEMYVDSSLDTQESNLKRSGTVPIAKNDTSKSSTSYSKKQQSIAKLDRLTDLQSDVDISEPDTYSADSNLPEKSRSIVTSLSELQRRSVKLGNSTKSSSHYHTQIYKEASDGGNGYLQTRELETMTGIYFLKYNFKQASESKSFRSFISLYVFPAITVLMLFRISRVWNQTGIKWIAETDTGDWLMLPEHKSFLSALSIVSLIISTWTVTFYICPLSDTVLFGIGAVFVYLYRAATGSYLVISNLPKSENGIWEARAVYLVAGFINLKACLEYLIKCRREINENNYKETKPITNSVLPSLALVILLLMRPQNIAWFTLVIIMEKLCTNLVLRR